MSDEKILKKEDKLDYKSGLFGKRGSLVLTTTGLYFQSGEDKPLSVPLGNLISVNAKKGLGNGVDYLFLIYSKDEKEKEARIQHLAFWAGMAMGNLSQLREPYFKSWEQAIENARYGRGETRSDLDDLEKLAILKEKGIITEEEFSQKKKQMLGL